MNCYCSRTKSRPSLSERINSIVTKYVYQPRYRPLERCPGPVRTCHSPPRSNSRPCSVPKEFIRSVPVSHQYVSTPCKKSYRPCSSSSYELISTCKYSPRTERTAANPPPYPGPNLRRYLSTKNICPSLKGRLMLYNCYDSEIPPTYRATSSSAGVLHPRCSLPPARPPPLPRTPTPTLVCQCKPGYSYSYLHSPSRFTCDSFPRLRNKELFRCDVTCPTRQHHPLKEHKRVLSPRQRPCVVGSYEPPFSSPLLEREFTTRFVRVPVNNYCTDLPASPTMCPRRYVC